ncbi:MAG: hypothetical protein R3B48_14290 [Kofleriaceae bacterium]
MRNSLASYGAIAVTLCLGFTLERAVRADSARSPQAHTSPHRTWGPTVRIGSVVGTVDTPEDSVTALGIVAAVGHRFGRLAFETESAAMEMQEQGPSSVRLGRGLSLGVLVRYDVARFSSKLVGPNTLLSVYVEGGAALDWLHWYEPAIDELARYVPADSRQSQGQAGFGISIDHRLSQPTGAPNRVAWHLGWRASAPLPEDPPPYACRGECRLAVQMPSAPSVAEGAVFFQSSLVFTW